MSGFMKTLVAAAILTTFVAGYLAWGHSYDVPTNGRASQILPPALVKGATDEALRTKFGDEKAQELLDGLSPGGYAISAAYAAVRPPTVKAE